MASFPPHTHPRKIAVISSSRADYGHLHWPMRDLLEEPGVDLRLWVTGAHLSPEFGSTVHEIEADGFRVDARIECLLSSDTDVGMAKTISLAVSGFADLLDRERPDLLVVIADRYEMLAPATAALALRVPICHIEGGESSEGAIDHAVRNALTAMAHLHLTPTRQATRRLLAMGEEAWRVHQVGAPSIDHLYRTQLRSRDEICAALGLEAARPILLVAQHPVTLDVDPAEEGRAVIEALRGVPEQVVFVFPNADAGSRTLIRWAREFCATRNDAQVVVNLNPVDYWSLLREAHLLLGNSSSGIMETPSLGVPAVNVGWRQRGRERADNVIDALASATAIRAAMDLARDPAFRARAKAAINPYGDGGAGRRIATILADIPARACLLEKKTVSLDEMGRAALGATATP